MSDRSEACIFGILYSYAELTKHASQTISFALSDGPVFIFAVALGGGNNHPFVQRFQRPTPVQRWLDSHDWKMFSFLFVGATSVSIAEPQNPKGYCGLGACNLSSDVTSCSQDSVGEERTLHLDSENVY